MKRTKILCLVVVPLLLSACQQENYADDIPLVSQQDEYATLEDCKKDWEDPKLCQQDTSSTLAQTPTDGKLNDNQPPVQHGSSFVPIFLGPQYYGGMRAVESNGRTFSPTTNNARPVPRVVSTTSIGSGVSRPVSPSISRGGFGGRASVSSAGG